MKYFDHPNENIYYRVHHGTSQYQICSRWIILRLVSVYLERLKDAIGKPPAACIIGFQLQYSNTEWISDIQYNTKKKYGFICKIYGKVLRSKNKIANKDELKSVKGERQNAMYECVWNAKHADRGKYIRIEVICARSFREHARRAGSISVCTNTQTHTRAESLNNSSTSGILFRGIIWNPF